MTDTSTGTNPAHPAPSGQGTIDPLLDAPAPYEPHLDPMSPDYVDPFYDPDEWERLPKRPNFWTRLAVIVLILLVGGAFLFTRVNDWLDRQIDPPGPQGDELVLEVPAGASDSDVMRILAESGVISNSTVAQYWIRYNDVGDFRAGEYRFRLNSSFDQAVEVLERGPLPVVFERFNIPEGLWSGDMRGVLLDNLAQFDPDELTEAMTGGQILSQFQPTGSTNLEGLMFPATYEIIEEDATNERVMIQRLVNRMDEEIIALGIDGGLVLDNGLELTPYEVVIVASMIEEEAFIDEDRAKIARVIYNRLMDGEALGIDATTIYGVNLRRCEADPRCDLVSTGFSWYSPELFQSQLDDNTEPYNTRIVAGLPPTPISAPGSASLRAAMNPEEGDWKFYVLTDPNGSHYFTNDFNDFQRAVEEARANGVF